MSADLGWRIAMLGAVFLIDLVVFMGLCREELRDWHRARDNAPTDEAATALPEASLPSLPRVGHNTLRQVSG
ncbi:MAG TPA: hypothetical protein VN668_18030 [Stellaceae bacterium]|nr:hypothetical protein [Stellaceae bacterium]